MYLCVSICIYVYLCVSMCNSLTCTSISQWLENNHSTEKCIPTSVTFCFPALIYFLCNSYCFLIC